VIAPRLLLDATLATAGEAALGLVLGTLLGWALATAGQLVPPLRLGLDGFAAIANGIPVLAIGSVCAVTFPPTAIPVIVATLAMFFVAFVAAGAGFNAASQTQRRVFAAWGASRGATFRFLEVPVALPALADGLRTGAPLAVVGAIIGEWFSSERGLGAVLLNAMQNDQNALLFATALCATAVSALGYAAFGLLERLARRRFGS
jgi:ABC-type nitrate/sulfonate/bicarbonate transport system permease component